MSTTDRDVRLTEVGKGAYESIREMVAALECDYDRLESLKEELLSEFDDQNEKNDPSDEKAFRAWVDNAANSPTHPFQETAEELVELWDAAGECKSRDEAEERIHEDALSVEVRSGWATPGEPLAAEEFCILLSTGGPASRIRGELDSHGEPCRAWLEVQDWGTPWTEYVPAESHVLLAYARCFCFAS